MNRQATRGRDGNDKPPSRSIAQIESEIGRVRFELDRTVDALADELAWRPLLHRGVTMATKFIGTVKRGGAGPGAGRHISPIAIGLIGAGVAWLVADYAGVLPGAKPRRRGGGEIRDLGDRSHCTGVDRPGKPEGGGRDGAGMGGFGMDRHFEASPLVISLLGLVAGATAAALLPPTKGEREFVDRTREGLWQKAEDFGHRTAAQIRGMADSPTRRGPADRE